MSKQASLRKVVIVVTTIAAVLAVIAVLVVRSCCDDPAPNTGETARDALSFVVTEWNGTCGGTTQEAWEGLVNSWYLEITNQANHGSDAYGEGDQWLNGGIGNSQFADKSVVGSWGDDENYLEKGAAAMVAWHGEIDLDTPEVYVGRMRESDVAKCASDQLSDQLKDDCCLRSEEMSLGNHGLEFLHLSSCRSMDSAQWSAWSGAYNGAHQIDGFHGLVYLEPVQASDYKNFASDAFYMPIADAWIDAMYRQQWSGTTDPSDQCPVAHTVGMDAAAALTRITSERYDTALDPPDSADYWQVVYPAPCANEAGPRLEEQATSGLAPWTLAASPALSTAAARVQISNGSHAVRRQVAELLASLPPWDQDLPQWKDGDDWSSELTLDEVYASVSDAVLQRPPLPAGAVRRSEDPVVHLQSRLGQLRYISLARAWKYTSDRGSTPIPKPDALDKVEEAVRQLGLPRDEFGAWAASTQVAAGAPADVRIPQDFTEMYRLVTLSRRFRGVVVEGSLVRAAVSNRDQIQRLRVRWPRFRLPDGLQFRDQASIEEQAVQEILGHGPEEGVEIRARQAFVPQTHGSSEDRELLYMPAVVFSLQTRPTPYQFVVMVVE